MIFENYLIPTVMTEMFENIAPDFLKEKGIDVLFCDIDNTLASYEQPKPSDSVLKWCENMKKNNISVILVSNNNKERVELFNEELKLPAYSKSRKPLTGLISKIIKEHKIDKNRTAVLGDQLYTDALVAARLGIPSFIVTPIKDKKTLFFRFKRFMEKPYVKRYLKKGQMYVPNQKGDKNVF